MILCWGKYNKKSVLFIALGTKRGRIVALKVQEPPASAVLSDGSIAKLCSATDKLMKMDLNDRLAEIKHLIPEWSGIYRTYNPAYLKILKKYPLGL